MEKVPQLRFPGFSGEWETQRISEVTEVIDGDRGKNYPSENDFQEDGFCLFLNAKNVTKSGFNFNGKTFISKEKDIELKNGKLERKDIVLTTRGTVGNKAYFDYSIPFDDIRINSGMVIVRSLSIESRYLYHYFYTLGLEKQIEKLSFGSAQPQLTVTGIKKLIINRPIIEEQQKIADFFTLLDQKIEKQQQKIEHLEQYKKGIMQQLFSHESNVPKLRFPEFSGEWEEKYLGDLANISTGKRDTKNKVDNGEFPFFVRSQQVERIDTYSFDGEAILTAGDGVGVGKVFHYINGKFDFHQRVYKLSGFSGKICGKYLFEYFKFNFIKEARKYNAKTSVDSVRLEMLSGMKIPTPSFDEQQKIANFLTIIDQKIEKQQKQLGQLKRQKKGLMQKMFV